MDPLDLSMCFLLILFEQVDALDVDDRLLQVDNNASVVNMFPLQLLAFSSEISVMIFIFSDVFNAAAH